MALIDEIKKIIKGDVDNNAETLIKYSHDASLFEVRPQAVVFPKDSEDVKAIVRFVVQYQDFVSPLDLRNQKISLTARSGGTDMTGGPLSESIVMDFTRYFNRLEIASADGHRLRNDEVGVITSPDASIGISSANQSSGLTAVAEPGLPAGLSVVASAKAEVLAEPGVWYRDFEKETKKRGWLLPSYPASKEICAIGGMVNNNSGGEKTLKYGKTENYVTGLKVVLADGNEYEFKKLTKAKLDKKMALADFEGDIYRKVFKLLDDNYDLIKKFKPRVSKNSSGYNIWHVWNREKQEFDLPKLFVGSQGTLGIMTEASFRLVRTKPSSGLLVIFLKSLESLPQIVKSILPLRPTSFESFDDHTFKLAVKFFWGFAKQLGVKNLFSLIFRFWPEFWMTVTGGIPKLVLLAEFEGDNQYEVDKQLKEAQLSLRGALATKQSGLLLRRLADRNDIKMLVANTEEKAKKYWLIRRESFNLLRQKVRGLKTAPFIDDLIVQPDSLPEFLPKLYEILDRYQLLYTIAGHVGDGNFHIIPLMKLEMPEEREKIPKVMGEVYRLVFQFSGSISAEHNDGLIRSPYLPQMFGPEIYRIFEEIKKIFDPQNIFNPGKKVGADLNYALEHIKKE